MSLLILFSAPFVQADSNCGNTQTVDLTQGYMKEMEVTDQGVFGNCYAHAAANLADAIRYREASPEQRADLVQTSPLHLSVQYKNRFEPDRGSSNIIESVRAARLSQIYRAIRKDFIPLCSQTDIEDLLYKSEIVEGVRKLASREFYTINEFFSQYFEKYETYEGHRHEKKLNRWTAETQANLLYTKLFEAGIPDTLIPTYEEIADIFEHSRGRALKVFAEIFDLFCEDREYAIEDMPKERDVLFEPDRMEAQHFRNYINDHFDKGNSVLPLGINYCGSVLRKGREHDGWIRGRIQFKKNEDGEKIDECKRHISVIVGRRLRKIGSRERCEFLVRNSWGQGRSHYSSDWQVRRGDIWIDAESLSENTLHLLFLNE